MNDEPQEPEVIEPDEPEEEERIGNLTIAEAAKLVKPKHMSMRDAQRAVKKFKAKFLEPGEWAAAASVGEFLKQKGKESIGLTLQVWSANEHKRRIEKCESLMDEIEDPELKVRLEENVKGHLDSVSSIGANLCKDSKASTTPPAQTAPPIPAFPANVAVQIVNNSPAEPKTVFPE